MAVPGGCGQRIVSVGIAEGWVCARLDQQAADIRLPCLRRKQQQRSAPGIRCVGVAARAQVEPYRRLHAGARRESDDWRQSFSSHATKPRRMVRETWQFLQRPQVVAAVKNLNVSQGEGGAVSLEAVRRGESGRTTPFACAGSSGRRVQRCVTSTATASPAVPTTQSNLSSTGSGSPVTPVDVTVPPPATTRSVPYRRGGPAGRTWRSRGA